MGLARSTYYDEPQGQPIEEARLVERIKEICAEWPSYGYRRVTAELHATGCLVNHKKVMRLMRAHALTVRPRRRFVATTDSDHDGPIFPNLAKDVVPTGANQLWVADITYIAIEIGFVYLAALLDAWSRRVVGYAIGRHIDARLALAALKAAIAARQPLEGCIHHSDRGSQYAAEDYRAELEKHALKGAMGRRGNLRQCQGRELHEDAEGRGGLPDGVRHVRGRDCFIAALHRRGLQQQAAPLRARIPEPRQVRTGARPADGQIRSLTLSTRGGALQSAIAANASSGCRGGQPG